MPEINLLIPGPTPLPPEVLRAMDRQMTNHRGPVLAAMLREILESLKGVFQTRNDIVPLTASGTGGLEASVTNFLSPGDRVLSITNGRFAERYSEIAERFGTRVDRVRAEWGRPVPLEAIAERIRADTRREYRAVFVTQSETSTGVHNDVRAIRGVLGNHPALFMVDGVSSIGAIPLETDAWGVDVAITGSQKALMSPPGMAFLAVSERAWAACEQAKLPRFYFDLQKAHKEATKPDPSTPFTPAITVIYAVQAALQLIRAEGLSQIFERHRRMARMVRAGVRAMGLSTLVEDPDAVDTVTPVRMPDGADAKAVAAHAREKYDVLFGEGIGAFERSVIRIGHLGYTRPEWLLAGLETLGRTLNELGHTVRTDAGLRAARQTLEAPIGGQAPVPR